MASFQSVILRFLIRKTVNWNKPLEKVRKDLEELGGKTSLPKEVQVTTLVHQGFKAELMEPAGAPENKIILYLHGGGYCLGVYNTNRAFVAGVASQCGLKTLLLDYRLAPEHPFPAALEDSVAAYRWLLQAGFSSDKIILMGDSSGCGLGLATVMKLREEQESLPAAMVFLSPVVDLAGKGESFITLAKKDPFQYRDPLGIAKNYVGRNDPALPMLSPLYGDMDGLPPMLIHAGDYDVFLSDATRLAEKAERYGVKVKLKVWKKMWHIFHMSAGILPEGKAALNEVYAYISEKMA